MFRNIVKSIFGDPMQRALTDYQQTVDQINALESNIQKLSDDQLKAKTAEFKAALAGGSSFEDIMVETFAVVREASVRTTGLRHYDVQMVGGIVLHEGRIAEMKTGEGKTLVATLPLYLNALESNGAHLVTPNDYLSKHGLQTMGPIYHLLGLSAAVIQNTGGQPDSGSFLFDPEFISDDARYQNLRPISRRDAYRADILYGTNNEFGFDYLRDNMVLSYERLVQRDLPYAIVDEVDNILIDEARTPLIISGPSDEPSDYYRRFATIVKRLQPSSEDSVEAEEPDGDFVLDIKDRIVYLTEQGVEKVENALGLNQLYHPDNAEMLPYLDNCLRAQTLYQNDKEYIVQVRRSCHRRRFHGPSDARSSLQRRLAPGHRSQGRGADPPGKHHHGDYHFPKLLPNVRQTCRHDRHRAHRSRRIRKDLRTGRYSHSYASTSDS